MIYLDNAATTHTKPRSVPRAVCHALKHSANPGRSGHSYALRAAECIYNTRKLLGDLFHITDFENIVLTPNATYALNFGIKGLLKPGDHAVTTSMEHNSVLRPLYSLPDITVTQVSADKEGMVSPSDIERQLRPETALIAVSHSSNVTGTVQDIDAIGRIAKKHQIPFLVDASQTAGVVPVDIETSPIDLLAFPGHKGLYGPQGTGGLYVRRGIALSTIIEGGTGSESALLSNPDFLPDRLESGTLNTPGFAGLGKALEFVLKEGVASIAEYEHFLLRYMKEVLCNMPEIIVYGPQNSQRQTGTLSLNFRKMDSATAANLLNHRYHIAVRAGFHCAYPAHETIGTQESGTVRISLSYFTKKQEVKHFLHAVHQLIKEG